MTKICIVIQMRAPKMFVKVGQTNQTTHVTHENNSEVWCSLIGCLKDFKFYQTLLNNIKQGGQTTKCLVTKYSSFEWGLITTSAFRHMTYLTTKINFWFNWPEHFYNFSFHWQFLSVAIAAFTITSGFDTQTTLMSHFPLSLIDAFASSAWSCKQRKLCLRAQFLGCTHVMRRTCWSTKQ